MARQSISKKLMEIIQFINYTTEIDGRNRILHAAFLLWTFQLSLSVAFILVTIYCGDTGSKLGPALLVAWQLMATQMLVCSNKLYDYAMLVDKNAEYTKATILHIVKEHWKNLIYNDINEVIDYMDRDSAEFISCLEDMNITCNQIVEDLYTYCRSMSWWGIVNHILSWKSSPDSTPWLEKDIVKDNLLKTITRITDIQNRRKKFRVSISSDVYDSVTFETVIDDIDTYRWEHIIIQPYFLFIHLP